MNAFEQLDSHLFTLINSRWHTAFSDTWIPFLREKENWIPLYIGIIFWIIYKMGRAGWIIVLMAGLCAGASDVVSSRVIKPLVQRERPCQDQIFRNEVRLLVPCGSGYSFTSSHAANHFALAMYLILIWGNRRKGIIAPLLLWAFSIAYAQVYVGVHYPADVAAGGLLGCLIAWLFATMTPLAMRGTRGVSANP